MTTSLAEEHRLIADTARELFAAGLPAPQVWAQLAQLGMLGLMLPEDKGGAGLGIAEVAIAATELGRNPVEIPFLASEGMALPLLAALEPRATDAALIGGVLKGEALLTLAHHEADGPVQACAAAGGYQLGGTRALVLHGARADAFLVCARLEGARAVFLVPRQTPGLRVVDYLPTGLGPAADLHLDGAVVSVSALRARGAEAEAALGQALACGTLAVTGEMVGAMEALLELTSDYLRTRSQFGVPLASFQALRHAATEMYVELELARSMQAYGLQMAAAAPAARDLALAGVKLKINTAARVISETAVQLHGGIGMTMESKTGRLFARLAALRLFLGDEAGCRKRLVDSELRLIA